MPIYEFGKDSISRVKETTFSEVGLHERQDLQRLLREQVEVIAPGTLVISEEFGDWEDARRRIDLLGIDKDANLVVIELKRTEDGGHMELQSIRYAATRDLRAGALLYAAGRAASASASRASFSATSRSVKSARPVRRRDRLRGWAYRIRTSMCRENIHLFY